MPKRIMREFALFEVSAVDRPCQEGARMVIAKRAPCQECGTHDGTHKSGCSLAKSSKAVCKECGNADGGHMEKCGSYTKAWWPDFLWSIDGLTMEMEKEIDAWALYPYIKREFTQAQRDEAERSGAAMSGGGFPIQNESDLKNAIRAIGRAKNPAAARAHIKTRAKALGLSDQIPDTWKAATMKAIEYFQPYFARAAAAHAGTADIAPIYAAVVKAAPEIDALPEGERQETLDRLTMKLVEKLAKTVPQWSVDAFRAAIAAKGAGDMDPKEVEKLQKRAAFLELLAKASDAVKAFMTEKKMDEAAQAVFMAKTADEQKAEIEKAKKPPPKNDDDNDDDDMAKALKKRDAEFTELTKELGVLKAKDELAVCKELCRKAGVAEGKAEHLMKLRKLDPAIAEDTLKEWSAAAKQTNPMLFAELGKSGGSGSDDPTAEIMTKAAEIRTAINKAAKPHEQITIEKARVLAREQFPDLAKAEREIEQRRRMGRAA